MNHTSKLFDNPSGWCIEQHNLTNHYYDRYLPYEFHLRMAVQVYQDFKHLLPKDLITAWESGYHNHMEKVDDTHRSIELACWGHDLIEDARVSFNEIKMRLGENTANIIYSVTNEKGRNREERANDKYYEGIRNTPGATFVKLCDRIANVQYSKLTKSRMFNSYQKENEHFGKSLGVNDPQHMFFPMYACLLELFSTPNGGFKE